jgi:hypothetical protein
VLEDIHKTLGLRIVVPIRAATHRSDLPMSVEHFTILGRSYSVPRSEHWNRLGRE